MVSRSLTLLDDALLRAAANGKSGEDMATIYPVSAAQAIVRVKDLLVSHDPWTYIERKQLLLHSAYGLKEQLEEVLTNDDFNVKNAEAYLKVLRTVGDILDKQGSISQNELETVTRVQAQALIRLIEAGYDRARDLLAQEYPDIDLQLIDEAFHLGMREASSDENNDD
jgi:uncharacterized protein (DUF433 family)